MRDLKTYLWFLMFFCVACPSGGIGTFGGLITKGFGFNSFTSILMQIPTGVIGIIFILSNILIQNKFKVRFIFIAWGSIYTDGKHTYSLARAMTIPAIAGAAALIRVNRKEPGGLLAAYYVCYVYTCLQPLLYAWSNLNAAGTTKRVCTTATLLSVFGTPSIGILELMFGSS